VHYSCQEIENNSEAAEHGSIQGETSHGGFGGKKGSSGKSVDEIGQTSGWVKHDEGERSDSRGIIPDNRKAIKIHEFQHSAGDSLTTKSALQKTEGQA